MPILQPMRFGIVLCCLMALAACNLRAGPMAPPKGAGFTQPVRLSSAGEIRDLHLPPLATIEGAITAASADEFVLTDKSGSILVRMKQPYMQPPPVAVGDWMRVSGILDPHQRQPRRFLAFSMERTNGEKIHLVPVGF